MRLCSGKYERSMRLYHVRLAKETRATDALTFMAGDRSSAEEAFAATSSTDNHGTIQHRRTRSPKARSSLSPASELRAGTLSPRRAEDPLKMKALSKGLVAAVRGGRDAALQADAQQRHDSRCRRAAAVRSRGVPPGRRVQRELRVRRRDVHTARWVSGDERKLEEFRIKSYEHLAVDHAGQLVYSRHRA